MLRTSGNISSNKNYNWLVGLLYAGLSITNCSKTNETKLILYKKYNGWMAFYYIRSTFTLKPEYR